MSLKKTNTGGAQDKISDKNNFYNRDNKITFKAQFNSEGNFNNDAISTSAGGCFLLHKKFKALNDSTKQIESLLKKCTDSEIKKLK